MSEQIQRLKEAKFYYNAGDLDLVGADLMDVIQAVLEIEARLKKMEK